jgi:ubiquinone/menaquinone biosynthesis C-methylase UbiE
MRQEQPLLREQILRRARVEMPMAEVHEYILGKLDLRNKTILDAAVGAGKSTMFWAKAIHDQGGSSWILAVDNDYSGGWDKKIRNRLEEFGKYVRLIQADILDLSCLRDGSIDVINCADTILFLNPRPLRLLTALKEFRRLLKPSGRLIVTSEIPVTEDSGPEGEGQWRRWNLSKAIHALKGETWASEPLVEDVTIAMGLLGFDLLSASTFPGYRDSSTVRELIDDWKEMTTTDIGEIPWDDLKATLVSAAEKVHAKVMKDGYIMAPAKYALLFEKRPE